MSETEDLLKAARAAYDANDWGAQERLARQIIQVAKRVNDAKAQARGFHHLGIALYHRNAPEDARAAYMHANDLFVQLGDEMSAAVIQMSLGSVALDLRADPTEARRLYDGCLAVVRASGNEERIGQCLGNLAEIARLEGSYTQAMSYATEALDHLNLAGDTDRVGWQYVTMAHCHVLERHYDLALAALASAYDAIQLNGNPRWYAMYFDAWLMLAVHLRSWETAAQLSGFLERYRYENAVPRLAGLSAWYNVSVEQVLRNLPDEQIFDLRMLGADQTVEQTQELVQGIKAKR